MNWTGALGTSDSALSELALGVAGEPESTPGSGNAQAATGAGTAHDATIQTSNALAVLASGTGSAFNATTLSSNSASAGAASGTGSAHNASVHIKVSAGITYVPTFVAAGTRADSASANISPTIPAGTLAGDILLLVVETNGAAVANPDSSVWTAISGSPVTSTAGSLPTQIAAFWRVAVSSTPAPTVVFSADHVFGIILGFRDIDLASPFDQTATYDAAGNVGSYSTPSITTTVGNVLVVNVANVGRDQSSTTFFGAPVNANLADLTQRYQQGIATGDGGAIFIATGTKVAAGSTGTTTGTLGNNSGTQVGLTFGLRPLSIAGHGFAYNATVSTQVLTNAPAEAATGSGSAYDASVSIAPRAELGAGSGVANSASINVAPNAGSGSGTGQAYDATVSTTLAVSASADVATGSGAAYNPSIHIAPRAGLGAGTGAAYDATVSTVVPTVTHVQSFGLDAYIYGFGQHDRIDFHYGVQPDTAITYGDEVLDVVLARLFDTVTAVIDPNTFRLYAYIADYVPSGDVFSLDAYIFAGHPITLDALIHKVQKTSVPFAAVIAAVQEWNVVMTPVGGGAATYTAISYLVSSTDFSPSQAADGRRGNDFGGDAWIKGSPGAIGDWWRVDWSVPQTIDRVMIFDGAYQSDGSAFTSARFGNTGNVEFSDGSSVPYSGLNDTYLTLDFAPRTVTWMRIVSTTAGASGAALAEVEAYNTDQFS